MENDYRNNIAPPPHLNIQHPGYFPRSSLDYGFSYPPIHNPFHFPPPPSPLTFNYNMNIFMNPYNTFSFPSNYNTPFNPFINFIQPPCNRINETTNMFAQNLPNFQIMT